MCVLEVCDDEHRCEGTSLWCVFLARKHRKQRLAATNEICVPREDSLYVPYLCSLICIPWKNLRGYETQVTWAALQLPPSQTQRPASV